MGGRAGRRRNAVPTHTLSRRLLREWMRSRSLRVLRATLMLCCVDPCRCPGVLVGVQRCAVPAKGPLCVDSSVNNRIVGKVLRIWLWLDANM